MKSVAIDEHTHDKLRDLVKARQMSHHLVKSQKGILAELIDKAHKREAGKR